MAKNQFDSPPLAENKDDFREYMLQLHNDVYGLGADTEGVLSFSDNVLDPPDISGTVSDTFTMDSDNTGGDVSLIFGTTNNESLTWNDTDNKFDLSDDLSITGFLTVSGDATISGNLITVAGQIVNTDRYTADQTLDDSNHIVLGDTDGGAFDITLPSGVDGTAYKISNVGSSKNDLTLIPNGTDLLVGDNANFALVDRETLDLHFETTEGWTA